MQQESWSLCKKLDEFVSQRFASDINALIKMLVHKKDLGHVFLMIMTDGDYYHYWHVPRTALVKRGEPSIATERLASWFYRPDPTAKYWVLKKEFRKESFLQEVGWV
jgi:hypothetical protein